MRLSLCAALVVIAFSGGGARAKVTKLEITAKQPYGSFRAGDYVRWEGRITGELPPGGGGIPDLDKAGRDANGMVQYSARIILFMPANPASGNGALLVDVPNRGNAYANALYNSPRGLPSQSGNLEPGTGFIEDRGYAVAEVYWELGHGADLPSFVDPDGKRRFVEGTGFAIVRDAADFLAHAAVDSVGTPNPLAGSIDRALAVGKSQDGRFLKTFLLDGFNTMDGRRVFDGMHVFVSAAGLLPILRSGTGPGSSADGAPNFTDPEFPGVNDGPADDRRDHRQGSSPRRDPAEDAAAQLDRGTIPRCAPRSAAPGAHGTTDLPLPENVRMYDVAGASHVTVVKADGCDLPPGRLDWAPVARATLRRLDRWVARNEAPPATRLMPLQPAKDDPKVLRAPKNLPDAIIQVPQRDADGNPIGGVRLPDIEVPLGVNAAQNEPLTRFTCSLTGAYLAFAQTKESADGRHPSLAERYKDRSDYVNRVRAAARVAQAEGFLLPEDAAVIINAAASAPIFDQNASVAPPR